MFGITCAGLVASLFKGDHKMAEKVDEKWKAQEQEGVGGRSVDTMAAKGASDEVAEKTDSSGVDVAELEP